jgi:hypothetical protein
LGERLLCKQEVVGSIPSGSTTSLARSRDEVSASRLVREKSDLLPACQIRWREFLLNDIVNRASHPNVCARATSSNADDRFSSEQFPGGEQSPLAAPATTPTSSGGLHVKQLGLFSAQQRKQH